MHCPVCDIPLVVTERQGVEIDHCPRCRGVWLDRGELDKLIERSARSGPWRDHDERDARPLPGGAGRGRRRRGLLDDLFDFD